jgi:hypothetical protein
MSTIIGAITKEEQKMFNLSYYNYEKDLKYPNNLSFLQWYRKARKSKLTVLTYPKIGEHYHGNLHYLAPDFVVMTSGSAKRVYQKKGQLIGVKVVSGKVLEKTEKYDEYNEVVFFEYLPNGKIVYMVGFYPTGNTTLQ